MSVHPWRAHRSATGVALGDIPARRRYHLQTLCQHIDNCCRAPEAVLLLRTGHLARDFQADHRLWIALGHHQSRIRKRRWQRQSARSEYRVCSGWAEMEKSVETSTSTRTGRTPEPRLGIAYQLTPKTVVRMGYGRSYDIGVFGSILVMPSPRTCQCWRFRTQRQSRKPKSVQPVGRARQRRYSWPCRRTACCRCRPAFSPGLASQPDASGPA